MNRKGQIDSAACPRNLFILVWIVLSLALLCLLLDSAGAQTATSTAAPSNANPRMFATPQQAADALIDAAEKFDVAALEDIFGPEGRDIIRTGDEVQDREQARAFAAQAREKKSVALDRRNRNLAFLSIGQEDWPFPVPIIKRGGKWSFDAKRGRQEVLYRRIGRNELDVIEICRGFVEAQHEYALMKRDTSGVNQYAQLLVSTPGKQDGLAWQLSDGRWGGPAGEEVARAMARGYTGKGEPFHGYFFRVLKGQGPAAPLGEMYFLVKDVMIGGFAMVASPAEYGITGIKSFIVSHDGVVYEKDLGPNTLTIFRKMELFNPDKTWSPVEEP
jgi:hypothetical protein